MQKNGNTAYPLRRTRVKDSPGIYFRLVNGKRRYEISYMDSDGRRRWKVVDGNLKDAEAEREALRTRIRRGERIAPSKMTLGEFATTWLDAQDNLRPRTVEKYETAIRVHIIKAIGRVRLSDLTEEHILVLIKEMREKNLAGWTARGVLVPLGRILNNAVRRGLMPSNPMTRLEKGERPTAGKRDQRILSREDISGLLANATKPAYRALLSTAVFSGMRLSELLGLRWDEVDFENGFIHVRMQLDRENQRVEPKTPQSKRDITLMPSLAHVLRQHKLASAHSKPGDFVFVSAVGTPLNWRNVERRCLRAAADAAGVNAPGKPRLRLHDCRHTFASLLISEGMDVVTVSRQLGHANSAITLQVYAHAFDAARNADRTREAMERSFGAILS